MLSLRTITVAAATVTFGLAGYAQTPVDHAAHHPDAKPAAGMPMPMAGIYPTNCSKTQCSE